MNTGLFPPVAEVTENMDGTFTVQLFENAEPDGGQRTAPSAQYTVNAYGEGRDDVAKKTVFLMR